MAIMEPEARAEMAEYLMLVHQQMNIHNEGCPDCEQFAELDIDASCEYIEILAQEVERLHELLGVRYI